MTWKVSLSRRALKDLELLRGARLSSKAKELLEAMQEDPFIKPPPWEKLKGDLQGCYSRRLNRQHRLVYQVEDQEQVIRVLAMWTHYGD